jgi:hypothetical protein
MGGRNFKAPRKAEWPPRVECLTTTTWHSGGLLPSFTHGGAVAAVDVRSHTNWVRRALQPGELMTAFEIPAGTQATFAPEVITQVCASLPTLTPVGVLLVLLSILVPLKGHTFTGGSSLLEKLPSRQKVAMLETANTRQPKPDFALIEAPLISPIEVVPTIEVPLFSPVPDAYPIVPTATPMVIPASSPSVSPAYYPSEGINVSATSLSGSPSYPSVLPAFSATALSSSPSYPSVLPADSPLRGLSFRLSRCRAHHRAHHLSRHCLPLSGLSCRLRRCRGHRLIHLSGLPSRLRRCWAHRRTRCFYLRTLPLR